MINDLKELNMDDDDVDAMSIYDGTKNKVTVFDRMRNSIYFIVSRAIKFGLDTNFILT